MKQQLPNKESKGKKQPTERGRRQVKPPAPQLPEEPNEAPHRAPLHPPVPEDDRGDTQG